MEELGSAEIVLDSPGSVERSHRQAGPLPLRRLAASPRRPRTSYGRRWPGWRKPVVRSVSIRQLVSRKRDDQIAFQ